MPKFVIERDILGIGGVPPEGLISAAENSNQVLKELGPQIQWVQSYVAGDKTYCIYIAPNKDIIRRHAEMAGIPANRIEEIKAVIDPTTAEG